MKRNNLLLSGLALTWLTTVVQGCSDSPELTLGAYDVSDSTETSDATDISESTETGDAVETTDSAETEDAAETADTSDIEEIQETTDVLEPDAEVSEPNACGGTAELLLDGAPAELGALCGCDGEVICNGVDRLRCAGDSPRNVCGGCETLGAAPGDSCGRCQGWQCVGTALLCQPTPELPDCAEVELTCADLDCDVLFRICDELGVAENAICADCQAGYHAEGERCVENECEVNEDCEPIVGAFGACNWVSACDEAAIQTRTVTPRTCDAGSCVEGTPMTERNDCAPRDTDGLACPGGECEGGFCTGSPLIPEAPSDVSASDGTLTDAVEIRFTAVPSGWSYRVERDGVEIGEAVRVCADSATQICYLDTTAPSPGRPAAVSDVTASRDETSGIRISWSAPTVPVGATRSYAVVSIGPSGLESSPSAADTGYRGAAPIVGYQVRVQNEPLAASFFYTELETEYLDITAPNDRIFGTTVTVTPSAGGNVLSVSGLRTEPGDDRSYIVAAASEVGTGPFSDLVTGARAAGEVIDYTWRRSRMGTYFPMPDASNADTTTDSSADAQCGEGSWNYHVTVTSTAGGTLYLGSAGGPYCY